MNKYKDALCSRNVQLYNNISAGVIVSNQSLVLQNVSRARAGHYTCVGSNGEGDGQSNAVSLDIKCKLFFSGSYNVQLYNNISAGVIVSNQSLVLQNVSRARAGHYTCVGSNGEGDGQSNAVSLDIKYAPVCRPGQETTIGVARNEVAKIHCEVEANPPALEFRWKFNNTSESTEIERHLFSVEGSRSTITFTPSSQRDYGTLLCWAKNPWGAMKAPCVYHVIPAGPPDSLTNCSILNKTVHGLSVECQSGFDGGLPQTFLLELYNDHSHVRLTNVTSREPHFTVEGLGSGVGFDIFLYAVNSKGRSEPTILQAHTLKAAEPRTGMPVPIHITPLLGFLGAGVGCLVFLACMIICLVRVKHSRSTKRHSNFFFFVDAL
ncbi:nephrin-like [Diaphorina citri]|uniref:Nephrin-like n=1 Tax=Diaphorina citri TaxID=121845 RepID=A0A3Q0IX50_DIACI|nr:nephrin-like [Diaphorina citri]